MGRYNEAPEMKYGVVIVVLALFILIQYYDLNRQHQALVKEEEQQCGYALAYFNQPGFKNVGAPVVFSNDDGYALWYHNGNYTHLSLAFTKDNGSTWSEIECQ